MGTYSLNLFVALLLTAASMVSAHAIPAIDLNVDTPIKAHELVARAAPPEKFTTNPYVATSAAAYTNRCQFKEMRDDSLKFTLNLAGWENTNQKKNHTISDDINCADELFGEIMRIGPWNETIYDWMYVPSYGAFRDTFVTFIYSNPESIPVLLALNSMDPGPEEWKCILPKTGNEDSWICEPQQLNI
ncbi:hypothetical protein BPAE_0014g00740 [Botrytis paeoniae]|uniref:Ecp2 effector protein domain-containing protein n=1 Tax=Botrytis paeoniae TaxID=278948 RepID=A0A4Z1G5E3_9HELO|nr:hypothetical protein BPAE_0014g00740 [Botrytis paeoniae]